MYLQPSKKSIMIGKKISVLWSVRFSNLIVVVQEGKYNSIRSDGLKIGLTFHNRSTIEFIKYAAFYEGKKRSFAIVIEYWYARKLGDCYSKLKNNSINEE